MTSLNMSTREVESHPAIVKKQRMLSLDSVRPLREIRKQMVAVAEFFGVVSVSNLPCRKTAVGLGLMVVTLSFLKLLFTEMGTKSFMWKR